jgi:hypothetical protein
MFPRYSANSYASMASFSEEPRSYGLWDFEVRNRFEGLSGRATFRCGRSPYPGVEGNLREPVMLPNGSRPWAMPCERPVHLGICRRDHSCSQPMPRLRWLTPAGPIQERGQDPTTDAIHPDPIDRIEHGN